MKVEKGIELRSKVRISIVIMLLLISGLIIMARLVTLQIIEHESLKTRASNQYKGVILLQPNRGIIFDRHLQPIAISIPTESLYANPLELKNPYHSAQLISDIIDIKRETLASKLKSEKKFIWIKRKLSPKEADKIKQLGLPGFGFITENKRFYPKRDLASQLLGFVGMDNQGLEGLEYYYDRFIKGEPEKVIMEKDAFGRFLFLPGENSRKQTKGNDLVLTIDETIQYYTEKELRQQVIKYNARGGISVVMDPFTGEILALADLPHFNPNSFRQYDPKGWKNSAITESFEPGSTFKIVTAAAALDLGKAKPEDLFFAENGSFHIHGHTIQDVHKFGWLTFKDIIVNSSNIGAAKLSALLTNQEFYKYISLFGFGKETGIDFPGENPGLIRPPREWSALSRYSLAFGQEISVTAIQLANAFSTIANGGTLYKPYIVKEIRKNPEEIVQSFSPTQVRRVISQGTTKTLTSFLTEVINRGTGTKAAIDGLKIAGKTGTAQKIDPMTGMYSGQRYISSFGGFVPADNPKLVIIVIIDEPKGAIYGGEVAAPVFKKITLHALRHLQSIPSQKILMLERKKYASIEEMIATNGQGKDSKESNFKNEIKARFIANYKRFLTNFSLIRDKILSLWRHNNNITSS